MIRARIYRYAGRIMSPFALVGLRLWTFISKQERSRIIVLNERREVLLVKGTISDWRWSLPGGGIEKHESPLMAAIRELYEETGIVVENEPVTKIGLLQKGEGGVPYTAHIYAVTVQLQQLPTEPVNTLEIADLRWFALDTLPNNLSDMAHNALNMLTKR